MTYTRARCLYRFERFEFVSFSWQGHCSTSVPVRVADHNVLLRAIDMQNLSCSCAFVQIRLASHL